MFKVDQAVEFYLVKKLDLYSEELVALGNLNGMISAIPDAKRFIKGCVIKEALLSSSIEGVYTTMLDVFTQPFLESKPTKDTP